MESTVTKTYKLEYEVNKDDETNTKSVTIFWSIPIFSERLQKNAKFEVSTNKNIDYETDFDEDLKFQLRVKAVGRRGQVIEFYYSAPCHVFLKTAVHYAHPNNNTYYRNEIASQDYHWVCASKWEFLTDQSRGNIDYSSLHLKYHFVINMRSVKDTTVNKSPIVKLCNDFENLLNNPMFSDVIIKSNQGFEFRAHKAVLSTRSVVLRAFFEHNMAESLTNIVESPFDTDVLKEVLLYIYTETVPQIAEMSEDLLIAADYYQLHELKHLCEDKIQKILTVENVMGALQLAHNHTANNLKKYCIEFIYDNDAKSVIKTAGWKNVESLELFKSISEYIIKHM